MVLPQLGPRSGLFRSAAAAVGGHPPAVGAGAGLRARPGGGRGTVDPAPPRRVGGRGAAGVVGRAGRNLQLPLVEHTLAVAPAHDPASRPTAGRYRADLAD